ncbi:magnesium/cobalt transporter CorA [Desulfovibrio inopinatus]|uniref:magnesium/cobalt transporter CorA n=1 Tax=Desulfovibrio inopinatus TaxID=102109 RepID=UPI0004107898|nr:magnesium/cobalt transporter CorA [Desulfovibrio inopinatus]
MLLRRFRHQTGKKTGTNTTFGQPTHSTVETDFIPSVCAYAYKTHEVSRIECDGDQNLPSLPQAGTINWIKVNGVHDQALITKIANHFHLHPLIQEDIVTLGERPKTESFGDHVFIILRVLSYDEKAELIRAEQVSIILNHDFILTFQESSHNIWDTMVERHLAGTGRLKTFGMNQLIYALLDTIIDEYFVTIGRLTEDIEKIEEHLLGKQDEQTLFAIYKLKREVLFLHKSLWPLREVVGRLLKENLENRNEESYFFMGNIQQDVLQIIEAVDTLREMLGEMLGVYMTRTDLHMGQIGQVLTVVATIFIPLTFITGFYGMNFDNLPLIKWKYGYLLVVALMGSITIGLFLFFQGKRWLAPKIENDDS